MTPEHKIAYHHLGDMLRRVDRQGSRYQVVCDDGAIDHPPTAATGSTVAEAAADCAAQLRAAGWVPTHPRLEWESSKWQHHLCFLMDNFRVELFFVSNGANGWTVWRRHDADNEVAACRVTAPVAAAHVAEWCAANLPNLHLPPFPSGDSQ